MSLNNNEKNNQEFNDFLQSLQDENEAQSASNGKEDAFPFGDHFDIDSFVKENTDAAAETEEKEYRTEEKTDKQEPFSFADTFDIDSFVKDSAIPSADASDKKQYTEENHSDEEDAPILEEREDISMTMADNNAGTSSYRDNTANEENISSSQDYNFDAAAYSDSSAGGSFNIKNLEDKISELESSFVDANKEKSFHTSLQREIEAVDPEEKTNYRPSDEFFNNMSVTIEMLKGSLKNMSSESRTSVSNDISVLRGIRGNIDKIVNARLQYEETLINQDQTLITRLREKTNRLKSINLALNSEVKRAKNEKLESLRKSAEQTKELLSLRVQLNKVEEKARHGDLKLSRLEQHLSILSHEKLALDTEIRKVREEKLFSIRKSSEQAKEIMSLRLALSKTEEKFKQEEIQNSFLKEQLSGLEAAKSSLDNEVYTTRAEREAARREAAQQAAEIDKLRRSIQESQALLDTSANEAGLLREKILSLETKLQQMHSENAALTVKSENSIKELEAARAEHEREIAALKAEQMRELELLRNQKAQEAESITLELRRAEDKFRQEETFVNTLKLQVESLKNDVKGLEEQNRGLQGKSTDLYREMEFIKEGHEREIASLNQELSSASEKLTREQSQYQSLKDTLAGVETEKAALNDELRRILSDRDEALAENERYIKEIETLKSEHNTLENSLRSALDKMTARHEQDLAAYYELKSKEESARRENADYRSQITELSAREEAYKRSNVDYEARLSDLMSREQSAKRLNEEYSSKIAQLEAKREEILKEKSGFELELRGKEQTFSKELEDYKKRIESLKAEQGVAVANLSLEIGDLKKEHQNAVGSLSGQISSLRDESEKLRGEGASLREERQVLINELNALKAAITGKDSQSKELSREIETLKAEIAGKHSHNTKLLADIEALQHNVEGKNSENAKLNEDINNLRASVSAKETEISNMAGIISDLQAKLEEQKNINSDIVNAFENAKAENTKQFHEIESARAQNTAAEGKIAEISSALLRMETIVKENESIINMLKGEVSAALNQKTEIDAELKRANGEKYEILKQLEEKTKALADFQQQYEQEVSALKDEHAKSAADYEEKLKSAEERLMSETQNVESLRKQISGLEQEKHNLSEKISNLDMSATKIVEQTDEIINLKSKLAKAESRFLQDTVLVNQLKEQFSESRETVARLENEILTLKQENAKAKEELLIKEQEIKKLTVALAESEKNLKYEHSAVEQLQEHTSQLKAVNAVLDEEVKKAQGEKLDALRKSADQAKEILLLRQKLSQAETQFSTLNFDNGIVSIRKEYEEKVEKLETELKDASAVCANQVRELEELRTDNTRLKSAEEEKLKLQNSYAFLSQKSESLENELAAYKQKEATASTLAKAKAAALSAQIAKITKEKSALKVQLESAMQEIQRLSAKEKQTAQALNSLKEKISGNDAVIEKLKKDIVILTAENRELKQAAEFTLKRERTLQSKIDEVEEENKNLVTSLNIAKDDAAKTEITLNRFKAAQPAAPARPQPPHAPSVKAAPAQQSAAVTSTQRQATASGATTHTSKAKTAYDSSADAIAAFAEPLQTVEEVEVESNEMDLSMIFGESEIVFREDIGADNPTATNPDIEQVKGTTINQPRRAMSNVEPGAKAYDQMEVTDHSIKGHGGVNRALASRLPPTYRGSEAYSDFLKKTKSVFYRIKWSLFKE